MPWNVLEMRGSFGVIGAIRSILSVLETFGKRPATAQGSTPVPVRRVMDCPVCFCNEGDMTR